MPARSLTPVARQQHSSRIATEEQPTSVLRLLDRLELSATEIQLAHLLARSSPYPVCDRDLVAAVTGCPDLDRRRRAVLEQQLARLRSKLLAHGLRILSVERFGYLLLSDSEE